MRKFNQTAGNPSLEGSSERGRLMPKLWLMMALCVSAALMAFSADALAAPSKTSANKRATSHAAVSKSKASARKSVAKASAPARGAKSLAKGKGREGVKLAGSGARSLSKGKNSKVLIVRSDKRGAVVVARRDADVPARHSMGKMMGLHATPDELDLQSSVALVIDQNTNEVLLEKNAQAVLPIASITKLMTALVVTEAGLPLNETLTVSSADVDTFKGSSSRLQVGTQLTRGEMLHLALMSSENRAAHALGRHYPGGLPAFVTAMNEKARALGMSDTRYVDPTGLSASNQSSASDLSKLIKHAYGFPLIRELSTSTGYEVDVGRKQLAYHNTNRLVSNPEWEIGLQKTGYISEAGRCLVMQAQMAGRQLIMVFLDSTTKVSRLGDAERVRRWIQTSRTASIVPVAAEKR